MAGSTLALLWIVATLNVMVMDALFLIDGGGVDMSIIPTLMLVKLYCSNDVRFWWWRPICFFS